MVLRLLEAIARMNPHNVAVEIIKGEIDSLPSHIRHDVLQGVVEELDAMGGQRCRGETEFAGPVRLKTTARTGAVVSNVPLMQQHEVFPGGVIDACGLAWIKREGRDWRWTYEQKAAGYERTIKQAQREVEREHGGPLAWEWNKRGDAIFAILH